MSAQQILFTTPEHVAAEEMRALIWNAAIERAAEIMSEWLADGRDELGLFAKLEDLKICTT